MATLDDDDSIGRRILTVRGLQVRMDKDLAALFDVQTRELNQSVKRNRERFPEEFCFKLTADEYQAIKSQFVILMDTGRIGNVSIITVSPSSHITSYIRISSSSR